MYCHYGTDDREPWWTFSDPCNTEVRHGARKELAAPAWLSAPAMNARDTTIVYIWRLDTGCGPTLYRKCHSQNTPGKRHTNTWVEPLAAKGTRFVYWNITKWILIAKDLILMWLVPWSNFRIKWCGTPYLLYKWFIIRLIKCINKTYNCYNLILKASKTNFSSGVADSSRAPGLTSSLQGSVSPPWCSIVGATVTVHQLYCVLHFSIW